MLNHLEKVNISLLHGSHGIGSMHGHCWEQITDEKIYDSDLFDRLDCALFTRLANLQLRRGVRKWDEEENVQLQLCNFY